MTDKPTPSDDEQPSEDMRRYAVLGETVHDPHRNYTVLGRIIDINRSEYDSDQAAAEAAAAAAVEAMPESKDDIVDDEFQVLEVTDSSHWVAVDDA